MRARAKPGIGTVFAFGGIPYTTREWQEVPAGEEEAARQHPWLEVEPDPGKLGEPETEDDKQDTPVIHNERKAGASQKKAGAK